MKPKSVRKIRRGKGNWLWLVVPLLICLLLPVITFAGPRLEKANKLVEENPDDASAYAERGNAYIFDGMLEEGIADFTRAIELNPNDADTANARGNAYKMQEQYDLAIADYTRAIELNPNKLVFYRNRAAAYKAIGDDAAAEADLQMEADVNPDKSIPFRNQGDAYMEEGKYDEAIAEYTKAIELEPTKSASYYGRGRAYFSQLKYDEAVRDFTYVIETYPVANAYLNLRGMTYFYQQKYQLAAQDFTAAIGKVDMATYYVNRARAYEAMGDAAAASADRKAAMERVASMMDQPGSYFSAPQGSAKFLEGRSLLVSIYLTNEDSAWSKEAMDQAAEKLDMAARFIEREGERYGKEINLIYDARVNPDLRYTMNYDGKIYQPPSDKVYTDEINRMSSSTNSAIFDYIEANIPYLTLAKKYRTDSIAFVVFMNQPGPISYAYRYTFHNLLRYNEVAVIFNDSPGVTAHEILHMFGAEDLYNEEIYHGIGEAVVEYVKQNFPEDIMLFDRSIDRPDEIPYEISRITAYNVGWLDEMPELETFPTLRHDFPAVLAMPWE